MTVTLALAALLDLAVELLRALIKAKLVKKEEKS